jgi:hypothetical protein
MRRTLYVIKALSNFLWQFWKTLLSNQTFSVKIYELAAVAATAKLGNIHLTANLHVKLI